MMSSAVLFALVLVSAVTASPVNEDGKAAITRAYEEAEQKLKKSLEGADSSVLRTPRRELNELKIAGLRDQDEIIAFGNLRGVPEQLISGITFWKQKMEDVIKPYVTGSNHYKGLVIDFVFTPQDPHWNDAKEYKDTESKINNMVEKGSDEINQNYNRQLDKTKARAVKAATASSWARLQLDRLREDAVGSIKSGGQWAKRDAAEGKTETALRNVKQNVQDKKNEFDHGADKIYKEYQAAIQL